MTNYPCGGVGEIATRLMRGIERSNAQSRARYGVGVKEPLFDSDGRATGVQLAGGEELYAKVVLSNTRWPLVSKVSQHESLTLDPAAEDGQAVGSEQKRGPTVH